MNDFKDLSPELEDRPIPLSSPPLVCNQNLTTIDWELAEDATRVILSHIQPTVVSEKKRNDVIRYMQGLIGNALDCKVLQYGSVPLKTYLPDGDIDLSAFGAVMAEGDLSREVLAILQREELNKSSNFGVADVQFISAEVKLVKCLVKNIVVDTSFGQSGGLSSLCFLEQVDRLIGKHNLFKRSIILIKAWCFYESRILGAFHGLLSTYAVEILVLYIFHLFHSSLNGPLAVLYKFLEHFSKFDWDNYGVSLDGPIQISSLPQLVAEVPENGGDELLISNEFLRSSIQLFADPSGVSQTISKGFSKKHLHIVDPIRESNNIGRSVNKGNFLRIQSAFKLGAQRLRKILTLPKQGLADEIHKFFSSTLSRPGNEQRPNIREHVELTASRHANLRGIFMNEIVDFENSYSNEARDVIVDKSKSSRGIGPSISHVGGSDNAPHIYRSRSFEDRGDDTTLSGSTVYFYPNSSERVSPTVSGEYGEHENQDSVPYDPRCIEHAAPSHSVPTPQYISQSQGQVPSEKVTGQPYILNLINTTPPPSFYAIPNAAFGREVERPQRHGTGTYIPNTIYYRPTYPNPRPKTQARVWVPRNNARDAVPVGTNVQEVSYEVSQEQFPALVSYERDVKEDGGTKEPNLQLKDEVQFPSLPVFQLKDDAEFPPLTISKKR